MVHQNLSELICDVLCVHVVCLLYLRFGHIRTQFWRLFSFPFSSWWGMWWRHFVTSWCFYSIWKKKCNCRICLSHVYKHKIAMQCLTILHTVLYSTFSWITSNHSTWNITWHKWARKEQLHGWFIWKLQVEWPE